MNNRLRQKTYLTSFIFTLTLSLPAYIESLFLSDLVGEKRVGLVFAAAAIVSIIGMGLSTKLLAKKGNLPVTRTMIIMNIVAAAILALTNWPVLAIVAFVVFYALGSVIRLNLELYLEHLSDNAHTGHIRGLYLTVVNIAWLFSPLLAGLLVRSGNYQALFALCAVVLLPVFYLSKRHLTENHETHYHKLTWVQTFFKLARAKTRAEIDLRTTMVIDWLLNLFYAIMVIYTPLYLYNQIGLSTVETGLIFTLMLLPFVILELPLGEVADRTLGEKEILTAGLIIAGLFTCLIPFVESKSLLVWGLLLFLTRVGASAIEVMKESYLFKKISDRDLSVISLSRASAPVALIVGPALASLILIFGSYTHLFVGLGILMIAGSALSLSLVDTK